MSEDDISQLSQTLNTWFTEEGVLHRVDQAPKDSDFGFIVKLGNKFTTSVYKRHRDVDSLILEATLYLNEKDLLAVASLSRDAHYKLRLELCSLMHVGCVFGGIVSKDDRIHIFVVKDQIYFDGLTKDALMSRLRSMENIRLNLQTMITINLHIGSSDDFGGDWQVELE